MGRVIRLIRSPLDANRLVGRLERLLGPGVQGGAVEENGLCIFEIVISEEIASLELVITLQLYRKHVNRMDEHLTEFRQSQELP
ncbi:hypothetical protein D1007_03530 [Hordeum vulgare]|nr:hypothetical protein D1007_03530 [Hordeum vulgare]